ncbi:EPIDERMAL PATTERNING FACTOR-like protein 2 [Carica papaya]|uniref:EPIDERMAL PATTERNING FACTOR-like protein 2 n=1 Tax=Carica papaya TaxID=3649 RepID=UPI000B8D0090|nr:EPIDERMAL PATTERNING FACTOR-like protein 2 [Carica papaya]
MGSSQNCIFCRTTTRHLIISLLLLLVSSFTQVTFVAEARAISELINATQKADHEEDKVMMMVRRNLIGSAPPRCERRCKSCEHCEAIQVPVTNVNQNRRRSHYTSATLSIPDSRGDDVSNYKPISWKCKCGNFIFNP